MEVYKKVGDRYKSMGFEFTGFPVDGIWLVKDGRQNCIIKLADVGHKPHNYVMVAQHTNECVNYIQDRMMDEGAYSINDIAEWAAEFYAGLLDKSE